MAMQKNRHGCLTTWLILMIIGNSISALIYLFGSKIIQQAYPNAPGWLLPVMTIILIFNVVCAVALFRWQKWGFWGFLGSSVAALVINLSIGVGIAQSLLGLLGVVLLYGVLNIGKDNKGWPQLE
jgi:hypothetical protein